MKLVSEQSDADIAKRRALEQLAQHLRALAANLMRTSRGAGAPYHLEEQMVGYLEALAAHRAAVGHGVSTYEYQAMLDPHEAQAEARPWAGGTEEDQARWEADGTVACADAIDDIRRASLQMTASMLVDQLTQMRRGESDIYEGVRRLEAAREKRRAYHQPRLSQLASRGCGQTVAEVVAWRRPRRCRLTIFVPTEV